MEDAGEIAGVVTYVHKSGALHAVSLDAPAFAAATCLQAAGAAPPMSAGFLVIAVVAFLIFLGDCSV